MEYGGLMYKCTNHDCIVIFETDDSYVGTIFFAADGDELEFDNSGKTFKYSVNRYNELVKNKENSFFLYNGYDYGESYDILIDVDLLEDLNITPDNFRNVIDRLMSLRTFN